MQYNDPRMTGSGVTAHSQVKPNMTAANMQNSQVRNPSQPQAQSPMLASLQRAPQQQAPSAPQTGMNRAAVGTFGPKTGLFQGIKRRQQTDFGHGGWQGGFNTTNRMLNNIPWAPDAPLGIGRRAKTAGSDYAVNDAKTILQRGYQDALGRQASDEELMSQLSAQGLKQGDRWAGKSGLDGIIESLYNSEEARNRVPAPQPQDMVPGAMQPSGMHDAGFEQPKLDQVQGDFQRMESPLAAGLQQPTKVGAQQAYQEYVSEFGPGDPEQPMDYNSFAQFYDQMESDPVEEESPMASALSGRRGWENLLLDTQGAHDSPMSFSGFNMERAMAGGDPNSVKDSFARAVSTFDIDLRGKSKEETGQILASPQFHELLKAQGIQSRPVPGAYDQIEVFTKENGWEVRDIVANAGSPDAQWWWGDVGGMDAAPMDEFGMGLSSPEEEEGTEPNQSALLSAVGGSNWKTLLDQLMSQFTQG